MSASTSSRPSVVVVGGGFAGFFAARTLERLLPAEAADLTMISANDHLAYSPLLPEVAAGRLDPKRIAGPLQGGLRRARVVQATVEEIDCEGRTLTFSTDCEPSAKMAWDRLTLTTGSITRILPTPGLTSQALGLKNLVEADYVHDHVLRQLELADSTRDPAERRGRARLLRGGARGGPAAAPPRRHGDRRAAAVENAQGAPSLSPALPRRPALGPARSGPRRAARDGAPAEPGGARRGPPPRHGGAAGDQRHGDGRRRRHAPRRQPAAHPRRVVDR